MKRFQIEKLEDRIAPCKIICVCKGTQKGSAKGSHKGSVKGSAKGSHKGSVKGSAKGSHKGGNC